MPRSAKSPCRQPGCPKLLDSPGYCDAHRKQAYKVQRQTMTPEQKDSQRFYFRASWKRFREAHLNAEPLCRICKADGRLVEAVIVDHIIPRSEGGAGLDHQNCQSLCAKHHAIKTRKEEARRKRQADERNSNPFF